MTSMNDQETSSPPVRLGTLEQQVMDLLWDREPLTVRGIIDLCPTHPAYTTISTVLTNLERKCLVGRERQGRSVLHNALVSRAEHTASLMQTALANAGDRTESILRFVDGIDEQDVRTLRDYLNSRDADT